jgi:uncharacterized alpha-E superfamily protein
MLGKTAGGLFWMFRYLERSDNVGRLIDAGLNIALTPSADSDDVWQSVLATAGALETYRQRHDSLDPAQVVNFLLREPDHAYSVMSMIEQARNNARMVRTALTREVWEAMNQSWIELGTVLQRPVKERDIQHVLELIRGQSALVHGSLHGTMLRNDTFAFTRLGTSIERAGSTARILDVKYYVLLPSAFHVGSPLDNVQWEVILRSVSARQSYLWLKQGDIQPSGIIDFLLFDRRMPRSIAFCVDRVRSSLGYLADDYGRRMPCHDLIDKLTAEIDGASVDSVINHGLHEFLMDFTSLNSALGFQIEKDYRFYA